MSLRAMLERQILDEGRVRWTEEIDAGGSSALFKKLIEALEELQAAGLVEEIRRHPGSYRGIKRIDKVSISGVNEDYDIRIGDKKT